jgi:hypothetical protein
MLLQMFLFVIAALILVAGDVVGIVLFDAVAIALMFKWSKAVSLFLPCLLLLIYRGVLFTYFRAHYLCLLFIYCILLLFLLLLLCGFIYPLRVI